MSADIVIASDGWTVSFDAPADLARRVLTGAAAFQGISGHVDVLLTHDACMRALNHRWRGKNAVTDILSFPAGRGQPRSDGFLGDLAIGHGATLKGASQCERPGEAHLSHLLVHGLLHLLGYDHQSKEDERVMQGKERDILNLFGIADPYV